ncbi:hypothetical protein [Actinomadura sp. RB99]|uniref:hypothetical protein n=1 Tax=Actinomadura sp. RB99 TaxID=2691577 RepID=UPI00168784C6|nr:hypothetical protein [Actinomadura sp. RB99]
MTEEGTELPAHVDIDDLKRRLPPDDPRLNVEARCIAANIDYEWLVEAVEKKLQIGLRVDLPNGKEKRPVYLNFSDCVRLLGANFQEAKFLGDYWAVHYIDTGTIEARIKGVATPPSALRRFSGVMTKRQSTLFDEDEESSYFEETDDPTSPWRLQFKNSGSLPLSAEIGTASDRFAILTSIHRPLIVLRLEGVKTVRHDEALDLLRRVSSAIFFDLDVRHDIACGLSDYPRTQIRFAGRRNRRAGSVPQLPRYEYQQKPFDLYQYGRSAPGMPLLQFLAFYQVLEYSFPSFSHREALDRLKNEVRDPSFDPEKDSDIGRLLALAQSFGRSYGNERDQLKATIRGCIDDNRLKAFVSRDEESLKYFTTAHPIRGLKLLDPQNKNNDIRDQVATRVYDIRCRVVHTKDEGTESAPELLLPSSQEAQSMDKDIELVRFLAQRVLIATASKLRI